MCVFFAQNLAKKLKDYLHLERGWIGLQQFHSTQGITNVKTQQEHLDFFPDNDGYHNDHGVGLVVGDAENREHGGACKYYFVDIWRSYCIISGFAVC